MEFKMVDGKSITKQVQKFQLIANKIAISGISLDENFHVGAIVSKLPPSWKEYRSKLLHNKEDLTLEKLLQHLQIEQETRWHDNNSLKEPVIKAHMVEEKSNKKKPENKNFSKNSQSRKEERKNKLKNDLVAMVTEAYVAKDQVEWWIDTGATRHISDHESYAEAMSSHDAPFWREVIDDEMHSILSNNTWILSDPPPGSRMTSIRILIALTAIHGLVIHQMDVKTGFQNGDLDKEVHMKQPEGFVNPGQECKFEMKDIGEADVILGIKIIRSASGLTLTQSSYIEKVLKRFGHFDDKPAPTPFDPSIKLVRNSGDILDQLTYSQIVGSLMYAMHYTRPDTDYAVETLSKFAGSPGVEHWNTLIRNSDPNDSKSIIAWIFTLAGAAISWRSKKQTCITHSTMESEFIAMSSAGEEADWLRSMLIDIPLWGSEIHKSRSALSVDAAFVTLTCIVVIVQVPGAEGLVVRVVSSVDKKLEVKSWLLDIFKEENYPLEFPYKSKVLLLFQRIESVEVCLFGMYVHEFGSECAQPNHRRVHLSLLDSVKYFRPEIKTVSGEALRTFVYHEILIGYLEFCKKRGFASCYIWASPPRKGDDYILYCHPEIQKTPKSDKVCPSQLERTTTNSTGYVPPPTTSRYHVTLSTKDGTKGKKSSRIKPDTSCCSTLRQTTRPHPWLGETISPMKEDFIMVHLQKACSHCHILMVSGNHWECKQCEKFQLCDKCYETEQKLEDIERHPINQKEKHTLYQSEIKEVPHDTKDEDEILENYDVCNACYQKDGGINHPHKLTNHPSSADCDAQNKEARQPLVLQVETDKKIEDAERYPINQTDKHKLFQGTITREPVASNSQPMDNNSTNVILAYLDTIYQDLAMVNESLDCMVGQREQVGFPNTCKEEGRSSCDLRDKNVIPNTSMNIECCVVACSGQLDVVMDLPRVEVFESPYGDTLGDVRSCEDQSLVISMQELVYPLDDKIDYSCKNDICPSSISPYNLNKVLLLINKSTYTLVDPCGNQGESTLLYDLLTTSEVVQNNQSNEDDRDLFEGTGNPNCDCTCENDFCHNHLAAHDGVKLSVGYHFVMEYDRDPCS
ncbi:putative histone acetyltransferase HAC-like 1 [Capsicum chinense]|nr:putative histone acetyltransferase HAC-like 1 [Capsicum chinense]